MFHSAKSVVTGNIYRLIFQLSLNKQLNVK